jgi:hypothetical protein
MIRQSSVGDRSSSVSEACASLSMDDRRPADAVALFEAVGRRPTDEMVLTGSASAQRLIEFHE